MFTVIIPTHDRPLLLRRTLQSLIAQTYKDFTVVIVADSSGYLPPYEELAQLTGRYVYVIRSGIGGPAESRNMGLSLVKSRYVIFLDDDDTFEPGHLQALADGIGDSSPEILFCDFKILNEDRTVSPPQYLSTMDVSIADVTQNSVYVRNRIPNSSLVYDSRIVMPVKYDTDLIIYEDWDFLLDCLKGRTLGYLPINSVVIHKSSATAPENMRRGNTHDEKIIEVMLHLYKKHPAPNAETRLARQALLAGAGVSLPLEHF
ncbi:glycosyltransferase family 2 protein [Undibacterium terreum]|uniref:Glycosyltransferase n=1 Tax=Undibacterium terreum TaxID=1224302 RepID=A0A916UGE3_9BURK|nr:glycosyltransferase family 2 protein [Undibacterium terreum]GGC71820.1 putative glycosyltransferase [Undibacterium terreum]